jgi:hypothetical protein
MALRAVCDFTCVDPLTGVVQEIKGPSGPDMPGQLLIDPVLVALVLAEYLQGPDGGLLLDEYQQPVPNPMRTCVVSTE